MTKLLCNREGLLDAWGRIASVIPSRSPKPILQNVKLVADSEGGADLLATDLEVGIRYRATGVKIDQPGALILPGQRTAQILRTVRDEELAVESDGDRIEVRGLRSRFELPCEDPDLFPDVPEFDAPGYRVVSAASLKQAIRRTVFATDPDSTRYALGGVLFEFNGDCLALVGTDGRRLATQSLSVESVGEPETGGQPVIPAKALKIIERNLSDDDPPVHLAFKGGTSVLVRTDRAVIYGRLVEGRYPAWKQVLPDGSPKRISLNAADLLGAVEQASIVTSEESRGVDFSFGGGVMSLKSQAPDQGRSEIELPIAYDGEAVEIVFDPRYLSEALKTLDDDAAVTAEIIDHKNAAVFKTEDSYQYIVMPLSREK